MALYEFNSFCVSKFGYIAGGFTLFFCMFQALSLFLLSAYYKFLGSFPLVAVGALLLYVGCYQVCF